MPHSLKTLLPYLIAVIGLIAFTALFQPAEVEELTATPYLTPTPTATRPPSARQQISAGPEGCITTPWGSRDGYQPKAPFTDDLRPTDNSLSETPPDTLIVTGTVYGIDCETPLPGVAIEVWHSDANGLYPDDYYRGRIVTDEQGRYRFITHQPRPTLGANKFVPARIHLQFNYPETPRLATQLFFEGDPFLDAFLPTARQDEARPLTREGDTLRTTFDVVLMAVPPAQRPDISP